MGQSIPIIVDDLMDEEIRRLVAAAIKDGSIISPLDAAASLLKLFPTSTQNMQALSDRLLLAAAEAGVAVEIGPRSGLPQRVLSQFD